MSEIDSPIAVLQEAIKTHAFPGAVIHLSRDADIVTHEAVGHLGYKAPYSAPVSTQTLYDLASLTKIYTLATVLSVLREAGIPLEAPLPRFFTLFKQAITLEELMSHRSGISFPIQRLEKVAAEDWLSRIARAPLESTPGTSVFYSCTNYFLLAQVIEKIGNASLDALMSERLFEPLQLQNTTFEPSSFQPVAPTEKNRGGFWQGVVHDEAARSWRRQTGSCAGNAGLFATAADVAHFAQVWTQGGGDIVHPDDVARVFATRYPENKYWRGLCFQLDAPFYMSEAAPFGTVGHLGFTGPSLVLHPPSGRIAVILNNRVHPSRSGPDRLPFHKRIAARFFESKEE